MKFVKKMFKFTISEFINNLEFCSISLHWLFLSPWLFFFKWIHKFKSVLLLYYICYSKLIKYTSGLLQPSPFNKCQMYFKWKMSC